MTSSDFSAKDVDSVLPYFADDVVFTSPRAVAFTGKPTFHSREELGNYWRAALRSVSTIRFMVEHVVNDGSRGIIAIVYLSEIDGKRTRAAELLEFNKAGQVIRGDGKLDATLA